MPAEVNPKRWRQAVGSTDVSVLGNVSTIWSEIRRCKTTHYHGRLAEYLKCSLVRIAREAVAQEDHNEDDGNDEECDCSSAYCCSGSIMLCSGFGCVVLSGFANRRTG
jgi:hypothetical protein